MSQLLWATGMGWATSLVDAGLRYDCKVVGFHFEAWCEFDRTPVFIGRYPHAIDARRACEAHYAGYLMALDRKE